VRSEGADVDDPDRVTGDEQRRPEHRLDPLLAQDRVEHVGMIDVVEDHRLLERGNAPGEAPADGDPHARLHLLLDADRRPRDQLVRQLVEKQHGAGIDAEQLACAKQERVQQLVEIQMRERCVRQRLQPSQPFWFPARIVHGSILADPRCRNRCSGHELTVGRVPGDSVTRSYTAAGLAAGLAWRALEPQLRRLFGHPYSDPELLTSFITRGRFQPVLDYGVQGFGGGTFGYVFARLGGRRASQALAATLGENIVLLALSPLVDRYHPDVRSGRWPPLTGNPRAAAVSVSGHLIYGLLLGLLTSERT
jgi:hypothetical protein